MITIQKGDIFESKMEVLVNPVNCVGVMGKGLALEFKKRYPKMYQKYLDACQSGDLKIGNPYITHGEKNILLFPTKDHWKEPSKLQYISWGLDYLALKIKYNHWADAYPSFAFPALGCGLGGLYWPEVAGLIVRKLVMLPIDVEIYEP